jgi:uncharacterized protein (DUF427 family)
MPRATWNDAVLAESEHCEMVEGNQYLVFQTNTAELRA